MAINVGIVGTGWVVSQHVAALKKIPDVAIRAIAGRNVAKAKDLVAGTGAAAYEHWQQMLEDEKLDAVLILLPPHLHGELELACAERVKGVLIEKPICADLQTAEKALAAFELSGTLVAVSYQNRYRQSLERTRSLFCSSGERAVLVNGWWVNPMPGPLWWRTFEQSGGQFVEQCTHLVDAARYVVGEITEVSAYSTRGFVTGVPAYNVDDAMAVNVRFASGAIGNFTTACHPQGFGDIGLKISSRTTQCSLSGWAMDLKIERNETAPQEHKSQEDIFFVQDAQFIQAVRESNPALIRSSYADALQTLRVTLAANESARTGRPVRCATR